MFRVAAVTGLLLAICIFPAGATTILVPSQQSTIQGGIYLANNGDTVLVSPGTYSEHITFLGKNIVVKSQDGPLSTIIQAANTNRPIVRFQSGEPCAATLEGFTVRNSHDSSAVLIANSGATLRGNIFTNNTTVRDGGAVNALNGDTLFVLNNIFRANASTGGYTGGALHVLGMPMIIRGNQFLNNTAVTGGAAWLGASSYAVIDHNLMVGNVSTLNQASVIFFSVLTGGGFYNNTVTQDTTRQTGTWSSALVVSHCENYDFNNNIIVNNVSSKGIFGYHSLDCQATYNDVWGNGTDYDSISPGIGSISVDPLFYGGNPYSHTLSFNSPCINAGDPASPLDQDGSIADMGAYYFGYNIGYLSGIVLDSLSSPLEGAEVTALNTIYRDTTDITGSYLIRGLVCDRTHNIEFTHGGYVDSTLADIAVNPNETTFIDPLQLRLFEYGWVTGVVEDIAQFPLAGVAITVEGTSILDTTDGSGQFMLDLLPSDQSYSLHIVRDGYIEKILPDIIVGRLDTVHLGIITLERDPSDWFIMGDINGDGDATPLADVVYGYNYLRGGTAPPVTVQCGSHNYFAAGDVDADCNFDQDDMWYLAWDLLGLQNTYSPCPDCPQPATDPVLDPSGTDPGAPDTVFFGYVDGSLVKANLYLGAMIPIFIKNDEAIGAAHIPFAADTSDFIYVGGGGTMSYPHIFDRWPNGGFLQEEPNQPLPGQVSASLLGWRSHATDVPCINTNGAYQMVGYFSAASRPNNDLVGDTVEVFAGHHSRIGGVAFSDSAGLHEWQPVVAPGKIQYVTGMPRISVSPSPMTIYAEANTITTSNFYITASGPSDLWYAIGPNPSWTSFDHMQKIVQASRTDTVVITFDTNGLPLGLNSGVITIGSNDSTNGYYTYVPVNLYVGAYPHGDCQYAVGDINGASGFNGVDVVYAVSYFKGGGAPPYLCECPTGSGNIWFVAGDVNASCNFNGVDVTYMVSYFKGGPGPHPCPDCPPVIR
jgi:hypothetical protein